MSLRKKSRTAMLVAVTLLVAAPAVRAVDGVFEINDTSIMAAGGYPFAIAASGSYVLTGNLTPPPGTGALVVGPPNVDIDLNGFSIIGAGPPGGTGIMVGPAFGVTIHDGIITGFDGPGITAAPGPELKVFKVRIGGNGTGIAGAIGCLLVENTIVGNVAFGIDARRCKIENNVITDNGDSGIFGEGNVIVHNVIAANGLAVGGGGVLSFGGSTIQENQITDNAAFGISDTPGAPPGPVFAPPLVPFPPAPPAGIAPQVVMKNVINGSPGGIGVYVFSGGVISDNTITNHALDGIVCGGGCTVRGNTVSNNNIAGSNGGITVGPGSTVNDNSIGFNTGIGAVLDITAGYRNNTFTANTIQDMSLFVPAAPAAPHPTSGLGNLCTGVPVPAVGLCP